MSVGGRSSVVEFEKARNVDKSRAFEKTNRAFEKNTWGDVFTVVRNPKLNSPDAISIIASSMGFKIPAIGKEQKQIRKDAKKVDREKRDAAAMTGFPLPLEKKKNLISRVTGISRTGGIKLNATVIAESFIEKKEKKAAEKRANPNSKNKILTSPNVKKTKSVPRLGNNLGGKLKKLAKHSDALLEKDFKQLFVPKSKSVPRLGNKKRRRRK